MPQATQLLIKDGLVITLDKQRSIYRSGYVAIDQGQITKVGAMDDCPYQGAEEINARGMVVMPGLVNCHDHLIQSLWRGFGDQMDSWEFVERVGYPLARVTDRDMAYVGTFLSLIELAKSGVTTTGDCYYTNTDTGSIDGACEALRESGLRSVMVRAALDSPDAPEFLREDGEAAVNQLERLSRTWGSPLLSIATEAFGILRCTKQFIQRLHSYAVTNDSKLHIHLASNKKELDQVEQTHGMGCVQYLDAMGCVSPALVTIHTLWLKPGEARLLAERGASVAYNPVSNMYLGSGFLPLRELLEHKVNIGLGLDGAATNNSQNMFETMKFAFLPQRCRHSEPSFGSVEQVLEMATLGSAKVLGLEEQIGSLEIGKRADIVMLNKSTANLVPATNIVSHLVHSATPANVDTVMVDGKVVVQGGKYLPADEATLVEAGEKAVKRMVEAASLPEFPEYSRSWPVI